MACNINGHILMDGLLPSKWDVARKLYPNNFADPAASATMSRIEVCGQLAALMGFENVAVGWNVDADLLALQIAIPPIQLVDLARETLGRRVSNRCSNMPDCSLSPSHSA